MTEPQEGHRRELDQPESGTSSLAAGSPSSTPQGAKLVGAECHPSPLSASPPQLHEGQTLLVQPLGCSCNPIKVRVTSSSENRVVVAINDWRERPTLLAGHRLRVSATVKSGMWILRAMVISPLLPGQTWLAIHVETVEEQIQRRSKRRVKVLMPLHISTPDSSQVKFIARSEDFSLGGIRFETADSLRGGTGLTIAVGLNNGRALNLEGVVVWCTNSSRTPGRFLVGARFLTLPPLALLVLERYLRAKGKDLE